MEHDCCHHDHGHKHHHADEPAHECACAGSEKSQKHGCCKSHNHDCDHNDHDHSHATEGRRSETEDAIVKIQHACCQHACCSGAPGHKRHHSDEAAHECAYAASKKSHEHESCASSQHDCDHGDHDHSWGPWRYAVLLLPVVLYAMNMPNKGFSNPEFLKNRGVNLDSLGDEMLGNFCPEIGIQLEQDTESRLPKVVKVDADSPAAGYLQVGDLLTQITRKEDNEGKPLNQPESVSLQGMALESVLEKLRGKSGTKVTLALARKSAGDPLQEVALIRQERVIHLGFKELEPAAFSQQLREYYSGRIGRIKGQYAPGQDKFFGLVRLKMVCCGADVVPLKMGVETPESIGNLDLQPYDWIEIEGQILFRELPGYKDTYVPILKVMALNKIRKTAPEPDLYLQ